MNLSLWFSCTPFSLPVLYVLLYLSPLSLCHVSRNDPLALITFSLSLSLSAYTHHFFGSSVHTLHLLFLVFLFQHHYHCSSNLESV